MNHNLARWAAILLCCLTVAGSALSQNLFAPVAKVNDRVVTAYELDQRARMATLFRSPGDPEELALNALIDERLQLQEAKRLGLSVTAEEVSEGMAEFAGRANMTVEEFTAGLAAEGIDIESFRDFVSVGVVWRKVVRARFAGRVGLDESDVDAAIRRDRTKPGLRFLLSEIILPANTPAAAAAAERRADEISRITSTAAFESAARQYSAAPSRGNGGRIDWMPAANLPPQIAARLVALQPGQVSQQIPIPNAIALFQLRAIEETPPETRPSALEYAAFYIAGGRSDAALAEADRVRAEVDTCDDLYGVAKGLPPSQLERSDLPVAEVPGDVALELAKLDENEVSTALTRANGQTLVFLMLCERKYAPEGEEPVDRTAVLNRLGNERLAALARGLLAELRANATIIRP